MDAKKRETLEAAGWTIGDAAEFLELTEEEQEIIESRLMVGREDRRHQEGRHLTQRQLEARIGPGQSQGNTRFGMLEDQGLSRSSDGENIVIRTGPKSAPTEFEPPRSGLSGPDAVGQPVARTVPGDDLEDEVAMRGAIAIDIARDVIARFSGTLILSELPERQPEIVFDRGRQFRDDDDE